MRRRVFDHRGEVVEAEDVLEGEELTDYRRDHPRRVGHQIISWPQPAGADAVMRDEL